MVMDQGTKWAVEGLETIEWHRKDNKNQDTDNNGERGE